MNPSRPSTRRRNLALAVAAGLLLAAPGTAGAQLSSGNGGAGGLDGSTLGVGGTTEAAAGTPAAGTGSAGALLDGITVGGPNPRAGSAALEALGSGELVAGGTEFAQSVGSVGMLESLGSTGGSAALSVASSGLLPGSVYANPTGSVGSGVITLSGLVNIPELAIGSLGMTFAGGFLDRLGERQAEGDLDPAEIRMWHGVVEGSAAAGGTLEAAAGGTLPGSLGGSVDAVQAAAAEDPFVANERIVAEKKAEKDAAGTEATPTSPAATPTSAAASPAAAPAESEPIGLRPAAAPAAGTPAPVAVGGPADGSGRQVVGPVEALAQTGVDARVAAALALVLVALGGGAVAWARRRA